jgi:tetratricopeptide (TPR) repeat protein
MVSSMSEAGGAATQSGISFQNSVAAWYLGQLCDPREVTASQCVTEVRVEAPAHVDDIVVTFGDGHRKWIHVKERIEPKGHPWRKLWRDFERQRWATDFQVNDVLELVTHQARSCEDLCEISLRASGAQDADEWWQGLTQSMVRVVERVRECISAPHKSRVSLLELFSRLSIEVISRTWIESGVAARRMPPSSTEPMTLFALLRDKAARNARNRKAFHANELLHELHELHGITIKGLSQDSNVSQKEVAFQIPYPHNPSFTGREHVLAQLRDALETGTRVTLNQALTGLGGVGKTQIAIEYSHRYRDKYRLVWWVHAEEEATLSRDYARLAEELKLTMHEADSRDQIKAVRRWMEQNSGWLIIFDNAEEPTRLLDYLPQAAHGHVLITSRNPNWTAICHSIAISGFRRDESIAFLVSRTGDPDREAAAALAEDLGDLPLALEQAASYVEETGSSLASYHGLFRSHQEELLRSGPRLLEYPAYVGTTWNLSFERIKSNCPPAADLLRLCSFFAPEEIPRGTIQRADDYVPVSLLLPCNNQLEFDKVIAALRRYSLIVSQGEMLSVHRLVQAVTRHQMSPTERRELTACALSVVLAAFRFPLDGESSRREREHLVSHVFAIVEHAQQLGTLDKYAVKLLGLVGEFLTQCADYVGAKRALLLVVQVAEQVHGESDVVGICHGKLATVLVELDELTAARQHCERALAIFRAIHGRMHFQVAVATNNLGHVRMSQGAPKTALKLYRTALAIGQKVLPPENPNIGIWMNNIGSVLHHLRDSESARKYYKSALEIAQASGEKADEAVCINNIGSLSQDEGDLSEARKCYERALQIDEAIHGPDHPLVALRLSNLGSVLREQRKFKAARKCYERAVHILERAFPPGHSRIASERLRLLGVLMDVRDEPAVEALIHRSFGKAPSM